MAGSDPNQVESEGKAPIAVLGYCMELPDRRDMSGDDLVQIVANKESAFLDYLETGICHPREYGGDDPWMYQHRKGNKMADLDSYQFDLTLLQLSEKESKFLGRGHILILYLAWLGLERSGVPINLLHKTRTGVFVAAYSRFGEFTSYPDETALRGALMSGASDRVAYFLGTHGPSLTLETACSSSLVAMTLAVDAIRNGSCDVAVVVASNFGTLEYELALQATGVISKEGQCRPFDEDASGTLRCDGSGCVVVCSMDWAERNGYSDTVKCVIVNSVIGSAGAEPKASQGSGRVYEAPNAAGMAEMIRMCHEQVGLPLESVKYVEAHATGTKVGDLVELNALSEVYRDSHDIQRNPLRVGSLKGNIGHAELAAGMFSLIKAIEMTRKRMFYATGGSDIRPRTDFDWEGSNIKLSLEHEAFPPDDQTFIGVNSFGVGGSYSHAVVTGYPANQNHVRAGHRSVEPLESLIRPLLLTVSAASARHLELYEERILEYLKTDNGEVSLLDLCGLFAVNRSRLSHSRSYLADSVASLKDQLASRTKGEVSDEGSGQTRTVAMAFTGQGAQWASMGAGLMAFKVYRDAVTRFDKMYRKLSGWSPLDKMTSLQDDQLGETMYAQPLTFMLQVGLVELLKYFGVHADVVVGHSAGEIAALYCCGMLSLEDSATVVYHRSRCQQAVAGCGRMLAVQMDVAEARVLLRDPSLRISSCEIACMNSPSSVVLAGPQSELQRVRQLLSDKGVKNTFLKGNTAFHCAFMDPILSEVDARLKFLNRQNGKKADIPFVSTVTAQPHTSSLRSEYIVHNIRQPVRFREAVRCLCGRYDPDVVIEIGPHQTLAPLLAECIQVANHRASVLTSLSKGTDDLSSFWYLIKRLVDHGICLDVGRVYKDMGYRFARVADKNVPRHPIIPQQFSQWIGSQKAKSAIGRRNVGPASGTYATDDSKLVSVVEISKATSSQMVDHVMGGTAILPGMYFVEAAMETWGADEDTCLSMSDVEFHEMCVIPDRSRNQDPRKLFVKHSAEIASGVSAFTVESRLAQSLDKTLHCSGLLASFPRPVAFDGSQYIPGFKGLREKRSATRDIGPEGIQSLLESHQRISSLGDIYSTINVEGVTEYGPSFQVIDEVRVNIDGSSVVATLEFDHEHWMKKGGMYGIQLLDGILQLCFLNPYIPSGNVGYAGGFDVGLFIRRPVRNPCTVHLQFIEDEESFGQSIVHGDALMYDSNGLLLCHLVGIKSIVGKRVTGIFEATPCWQPMSIPTASQDTPSLVSSESLTTSRDPVDVATTIIDILERRRGLMPSGGPSHMRILEFWEDSQSEPIVFDALAKLNPNTLPDPCDFIIEVFIATHDDGVVGRGYHVPQRHKAWLKIRLVHLPIGQISLESFCFDVIAGWRRGTGRDPRDQQQDLLQQAAGLGYDGTALLHDFDVDQTWEEYARDFREHAGNFSSCSLRGSAVLSARAHQGDQGVVVVCKDTDVSRQLCGCLERAASGYAGNITVNARSADRGDPQSISDLSTEVAGMAGTRHVVVLDGVVDESEYAHDTFILVARIASKLDDVGCPCFLWVVTGHALVPPIHVHRGSLLPLALGVSATLPNICAKFVDITGPYESLAALILSNPGPRQFMINASGIPHHRVMVPRRTAYPPREIVVRADAPDVYYKCELVNRNAAGSARGGTYSFFAHPVKPPGPGEVLVNIQYASMNFRDVMLILDALPKSSFEASFYGYNLGMEGSGTVVDVGAGVDHLTPGDQVILSAKGTIASKVVASAGAVFKIDSSRIPMKDAGCLLSVYATAYHALVELCQIKKGDRVLIHAAAGGVGHAAISICSYTGAEVYATSSQAKRAYCVETLGVPESRLFSSRDLSWFDALMRSTKHEGVDVVLNSLAGEHQRLGIQCLRPGGRFCEIGKLDIFNNERLFLFAFRKNIHLFAIDMDRMALDDPVRVRSITERVVEHLYRGHYELLPSTCFPMDRIKDAVELMKSGAHIGKVVLSNYFEDRALAVPCRRRSEFDGGSYHLVLGGAGGFGSKIIRWLYKKGARKFITTVSRDPSRVTKMFADLIGAGAVFETVEADLSNEGDLEAIERVVLSSPIFGRVETMVHCAGIYEAFRFEDAPDDALHRQCDIKVRSALFLDELSRKLGSVKHFIIVGSSSAEITGRFFESYGASNAILGSVARKRRSDGLPTTMLHMSTLRDVGMVAKEKASIDYQNKLGFELINSARAVLAFDSMVSENTEEMAHLLYYPEDASRMGTGWNQSHLTPAVNSLLVFGAPPQASCKHGSTYEDILQWVTWLLADSMAVDPDSISSSTSLSQLGIDSLGIMDVAKQLQDEFGYAMDRTAFAMSVGDLARDIQIREKELMSDQGQQDVGEKDIDMEVQGSDAGGQEVHSQDGTQCIYRNYNVAHPKGYAVVLPGADRKGAYFADWRLEDIQILLVDTSRSDLLDDLDDLQPKLTAKMIAKELHKGGYLKADTKIVLVGYSFGSLVALEVCKELLDGYAFSPVGLIPICYAAPQACTIRVDLLPKAIRSAILKREVLREYGDPDPGDEDAFAVGLAKHRPSDAVMYKWGREGQAYFKEVLRDLKRSPGHYIGSTPIHYVCATKDRIGNPKRLSDPKRHGWSELTSGPVGISSWYGGHTVIVDPTTAVSIRGSILELISAMVTKP